MTKRSSTNGQLRVLDLFSGLGGLSAGLASTGGFDIVAACEMWPPAVESFRKNHPEAAVIEGDLILEATKRQCCQPFKDKPCDVVVGGVPCQSYSLAGDQDPEDPRFWLFEEFLDVVGRLKPSVVVIENVVGMLTAETPDGDKVLGRISEGLHALGFSVAFDTVNAVDFGTPQSRDRVVVFGWRRGDQPRLARTHDQKGRRGLPPWLTLKDALDGLPAEPCDHVQFDRGRLKLLRMLTAGQDWRNLPEELHAKALGKLYDFPGGSTGVCRRLAWDEPSPTLMTSPTMRKTCLCHPDEHRPLSTQEYRRIMGFPDGFAVCGTATDGYRQLGNAVPFPLGRAIGLAVLRGLGLKPQDAQRKPVAPAVTTTDEASGLPIHPLALLFPPMPQAEMDALAEDIRRHGLVEDVVMHEEMVLDGVHRLKACGLAGVKPRFRKWDGEGGTPIQYVLSRNWSRRHLTASQRAAVAVVVEEEFARQAIRGRPRKDGKGGTITPVSGKSRDRTAGVAGVSPRYVQDAKFVAKISPVLLEDVRCGRMTLPESLREAKRMAGGSGNGGSGKPPPTHRVELEVLGQTLRSPTLPADEATELAAALSDRVASGSGVRLSVVGDGGTAVVRLRGKGGREIKAEATAAKSGKAVSHMYADAKTWNPFKGCEFACSYCVPSFQRQAKRQKQNCDKCYRYVPHEHPDRLTDIPNADIVFVCGNGDISFCDPEFVRRIIEVIRNHKGKTGQTFYLQSKKPLCLKPHLKTLPDSVAVVTTLETNRDEGYDKVSKAPPPSERFRQFLSLDYPRKVVTIEPAMDFDAEEFAGWIARIKPEYVWLGLNSRNAEVKLPDPSSEKLREFASILVARGIEVRGKHLRGLEMPAGVKRYQD